MRNTSLVLLLAAALATGCTCAGGDPAGGGTGGGGGDGGTGGGGAAGGGGTDTCDLDGDGHAVTSCGGDDCNDRDATVHPAAAETCDGSVDQDCDGSVDEGCECTPGDWRACWPRGPDDPSRNVGACEDGAQRCFAGGTWGACEGAVGPGEEGAACDGLDQDCDGEADEGLTGACGTCGEASRELCANGLDDDCDGVIDDPDVCRVRCAGVDSLDPDPPALACCFRDPDRSGSAPRPIAYSNTCVDWEGLPPCSDEARACLDLDGDPSTECVRSCTGRTCVCGVRSAGGADPVLDDRCGFETACAYLDCDDRTNQPCYSGPPATLGAGACRGGTHSCSLDPRSGVRSWGACEGEVLPAGEVCGDRVDNDCDGRIDEEDAASGQRCPVTRCAPDAPELCGNGLDDDCDGFADEGCRPDGTTQACYTGPVASRGIGRCRDGTQAADGDSWGPCAGDVRPGPEACGDGIDSDCDGFGAEGQPDDDGCCEPVGPESCNGRDDDCDGLVDEGVLSACGLCDEPCYTEEFEEPARCAEGSGRTCTLIVEDPNNPDAFTLDNDKGARGSAHVIYIAVTGRDEVAKLDTLTGQKLWQVPTLGDSPSRTAVALDTSVWVGNRGLNCNSMDPTCSSLVHIDTDGNLVCKADIVGTVRGVAIDANGDVWAGTYNTNKVYRVHGNRTVGPGGDGVERCDIFDLDPNDPNELGLAVGQPVYGLAIDGRGILWTASTPTVRIDTVNLTMETVQHDTHYGVAIDGNNDVWFGGGSVHRVAGSGPYANPALYVTRTTADGGYAVTVASDGAIWASDLSGARIIRVDPATMTHTSIPLPAGYTSPHGIAEDAAGKIWVPLWVTFGGGAGYALRYDPLQGTWDAFEVEAGQELYTYSDMTGSQLRRFVARQGSWVQTFDSGYTSTDWKRVDWDAALPAGTSIEVYARFASTRTGLATTGTVCGPFTEPPADLDACPGADGNRFAAVEFLLRSGPDQARPTVANVELTWTRP